MELRVAVGVDLGVDRLAGLGFLARRMSNTPPSTLPVARPASSRGISALALASVVLLACGPAEAELSRLREDLSSGRDRARAADVARATGVEADLQAPKVSATQCPTSVVLTSSGKPPSNPVGYLVGRNPGNYREVVRTELGTAGTRLKWAEALASTVSGALAPDARHPVDSEEALAFRRGQVQAIGDPSRTEGYRYDVELVILEQVSPRVVGDGFLPGSVRARLVVWDYAEGRVVCHADAEAASLDEERVAVGVSEASLSANLMTRVRIAALEGVGL